MDRLPQSHPDAVERSGVAARAGGAAEMESPERVGRALGRYDAALIARTPPRVATRSGAVCFAGPQNGGFSLRQTVPGGVRVALFTPAPVHSHGYGALWASALLRSCEPPRASRSTAALRVDANRVPTALRSKRWAEFTREREV